MGKHRILGFVAAAAAVAVGATACEPAPTVPAPASTGVAMKAAKALESANVSVTPNGRYVSFSSGEVVVPGFQPLGSHGVLRRHIYRLDRSTGAIVAVSVSSDGTPLKLDHNVASPQDSSMSDDGRFIAFSTTDPQVVPHDTVMRQPPSIDTTQDVFVRDVVAGTTQRIELPGGVDLNGPSGRPKISGNGRWVAFSTAAGKIDAADTNAQNDIYRWDRTTGALVRVTQAAGGGPTDKTSLTPIPFDNGDVAFSSRATNLGSGFAVTDNRNYVYVKNMTTGALQVVSVTSTGAPISSDLVEASSDGSRILFQSSGAGVPDDTPGATVFLRDRTAGTTQAAIRNASGSVFELARASISANGRFVTVASRRTDIVPGDVDGATMDDLFVRDLATNKKHQVNRNPDGSPGPLVSTGSFDLSDDGRTVVFTSNSHSYAPDDGTYLLRAYVQRTPLP